MLHDFGFGGVIDPGIHAPLYDHGNNEVSVALSFCRVRTGVVVPNGIGQVTDHAVTGHEASVSCRIIPSR